MILSARKRRRLERLWVELRWRELTRDPEAFFRTCVSIPAPATEHGKVPFELFDYQLEALATFLSEKYVVVLKARQLGLTTLAMAYALHELMHKPGSNILLVSKDQRTADNALEMLDTMWRFLPGWYRDRAPDLEVDSAREHIWRFPDGQRSRIVSLPATKTAGAGETATLALWDEAALAAEQEDTFRTLMPTVDNPVGRIIIFSTARGAHNRFATLYRAAERGLSEFVPVFFPWMVSRLINPLAGQGGVDDRRYLARKRQFAEEPWRFYAEYPSSAEEAFRQSGRTRFGTLPPIEEFAEFGWRGRCELDSSGQPRLTEEADGPLRLRIEALDGAPSWSAPVLSMDPASGTGGDFTAMTLGWFDHEGVPQIMGYWHANDVEPVAAARQADAIGRRWCGGGRAALLVVEAQGGYGDTPLHELGDNLDYPNLYVHTYTGHRKRKLETRYGFPMTWARRPLVIDRLARWLRFDLDETLETLGGIHPLLRHELGAFVVRGDGKVAADVGMHDDLVMATAIWLYVLDEEVGATAAPNGEKPAPAVQTFSVAHIFEEAEKARRERERQFRRGVTTTSARRLL